MARQLVSALILSQLDYCNSTFAGLPRCLLEPLQRIQNAAAHIVFLLSPKDHVSPCRMQLHWLPVRWRVMFKLCMLMHSIQYNMAPVPSTSAMLFDEPVVENHKGCYVPARQTNWFNYVCGLSLVKGLFFDRWSICLECT